MLTANVPHNQDPLRVCCGCFAPHVQAWLNKHDADHPADGHNQTSYVEGTSTPAWGASVGVQFLAEQVGVSCRTLTGILAVDRATVGLGLADALFVAMDAVYLLQELTIFASAGNQRLRGYYGGHICALDVLTVVESPALLEAA